MPIQVQLPDGSIGEFPDGMADADIERVLKQQFPQQPAESKQQKYARVLADLQAKNGPAPDPAADMSTLDRVLASAGKSVHDTGRGIQQIYAAVADKVAPRQRTTADLITGRDPSRSAEVQHQVQRDRELDAPLMNTGAGKVGYVGGQVAQMAVPVSTGAKVASLAGRATPFLNAAVQGGAFNALQPVGQGESRLLNTATGAALGVAGQGVAKGTGLLAKRAKDALNPVVRESIALARSAGIPLHPAQVTNSKALKAVSSALNYLPFSGAGRAGTRQQEAFNSAVGRSFGADGARVLSDDVMREARSRLSSEYTDIFKGKHIAVSDAAARRLSQIANEANQDLVDGQAQLVSKQLDKIIRKAEDGSITGEQYQSLRTSLSDAIDGTNAGRYIKQLRGVLDDIAGIGLGPRDAARLSKVRGQWANLRTTEDALKQVAGAAGNVRPASLYPLVRNGSTKEMRELAKIGQNVLKDPIPDSGTPARELVYRTLGLGGGAAGGAAALGVLAPAAKMGAMGITLARALNSPRVAGMVEQGVPTSALARLLQPAPRALPLLTPAVVQATEKKKDKKR